MGWNSNINPQQITVNNIDVIHVDYCQSTSGYCSSSYNDSVIALSSPGTHTFSGSQVTISNVRIEGDAVRMVRSFSTFPADHLSFFITFTYPLFYVFP